MKVVEYETEEESVESVKSIPGDYKFEVGAKEDEEPASVESVKSISSPPKMPPTVVDNSKEDEEPASMESVKSVSSLATNTPSPFVDNSKEVTVNQPLLLHPDEPE